MASNRTEFTTLKKLLSETELILSTTELPQNRTARCRELLRTALALTDDLISQAQLPAAAILGAQGRLRDRQARQCLLSQASSPPQDSWRVRPRKEPS